MPGDPKLATRPVAYDDDLAGWSEAQALLLARPGRLARTVDLDWQDLAEEVESLGNAKALVVESLLIQIALHLLKLEHSADPYLRASWRREVAAFRGRIARELKRSPSLRRRIDLAGVRAQLDREVPGMADMLGIDRAALADALPYGFDRLADPAFEPANRHGLT